MFIFTSKVYKNGNFLKKKKKKKYIILNKTVFKYALDNDFCSFDKHEQKK